MKPKKRKRIKKQFTSMKKLKPGKENVKQILDVETSDKNERSNVQDTGKKDFGLAESMVAQLSEASLKESVQTDKEYEKSPIKMEENVENTSVISKNIKGKY